MNDLDDLQERQREAGWAVTRDQAIIRLRRLRAEYPDTYLQIRTDHLSLLRVVGRVGHGPAHRRMVSHAQIQGIVLHALFGALGDIERLGEEQGLKTQMERTAAREILGKN